MSLSGRQSRSPRTSLTWSLRRALASSAFGQRLKSSRGRALDEQAVVIPGTDPAALIVPSLTGLLTAVLVQSKLLAGRIEELLEADPFSTGPGLDAHQRQDRGQDPHRHRRRQPLPFSAHLALPTQASPRTGGSQVPWVEANSRPERETSSSNEPSSYRRSLLCRISHRGHAQADRPGKPHIQAHHPQPSRETSGPPVK